MAIRHFAVAILYQVWRLYEGKANRLTVVAHLVFELCDALRPR